MATVTLKNVKKVYDKEVVAVSDFNLEIADKEFVVLVGPSGCGKSTTLRMVAGLEEITKGEIYIGDRIVNEVAPKDRDIAMVFQNYALYPHMSVYDNMAFSLKMRKCSKAEIDKKVRAAAEILDIGNYLSRKPKALSGGQRQRVAIGRAIVREPQVFLMDEPLSNLDAKLRNQMRAEIINLRRRIDTTFIYVTHDQTEAMTLGDRIVVMKDGLVMQVGTPQEVFHYPANLFVAGFIGTPQMNFFDAELIRDGSTYYLEIAGKRFILPADKQQGLRVKDLESQSVVYGIRPENIVFAEDGDTDSEIYSGKLSFSEMMGSSVHLHVDLNGKDLVIIKPIVDLSDAQTSVYKPGTELKFLLNSPAAHLFDKETEKNLL